MKILDKAKLYHCEFREIDQSWKFYFIFSWPLEFPNDIFSIPMKIRLQLLLIPLIACFILFNWQEMAFKTIALWKLLWSLSLYVNLICSHLLFHIEFVSLFFVLTGGKNKIFGFLVREQKGGNVQRKEDELPLNETLVGR